MGLKKQIKITETVDLCEQIKCFGFHLNLNNNANANTNMKVSCQPIMTFYKENPISLFLSKFLSSKIVFFAIFCIKKHLHNRLREKKNSNSEHLRDVTGLMNDLRRRHV